VLGHHADAVPEQDVRLRAHGDRFAIGGPADGGIGRARDDLQPVQPLGKGSSSIVAMLASVVC